MKSNIATVIGSFAALGMALILAVLGICKAHEEHVVKQLNYEWRNAAAPVFAARNVPQLASYATPHDLAQALDASSVMTHWEASKWSPSWSGRNAETKIRITTE